MSTKTAKPKEKVVVSVGKKKSALARARVKAGKGTIRINSVPINKWGSYYERTIVTEPLILVKDTVKDLDIDVWTQGGGRIGQAAAIKVAIARGIVDFTKRAEIRKALISYDDKILSGDSRQREPCKPGRSSPRSKRQKSYR